MWRILKGVSLLLNVYVWFHRFWHEIESIWSVFVTIYVISNFEGHLNLICEIAHGENPDTAIRCNISEIWQLFHHQTKCYLYITIGWWKGMKRGRMQHKLIIWNCCCSNNFRALERLVLNQIFSNIKIVYLDIKNVCGCACVCSQQHLLLLNSVYYFLCNISEIS